MTNLIGKILALVDVDYKPGHAAIRGMAGSFPT